jgi:hypothetical protein
MRVTKRQLRRIIKEEKRKVLTEARLRGIVRQIRHGVLSEYGGGVGRVEWTDSPADPSQDVAFMVDGGEEITEDELYDLVEDDEELRDDADASRSEYNEYMNS